MVANKCDMPGVEEAVEALRSAAEADGYPFFAISALTGEGIDRLVLQTASHVAKLRAESAAEVPAQEGLSEVWEKRRASRDKRIEVTCEEPGVWRVSGTNIERMVVQTDWDNDEAVDYLQRRFTRLKLEELLAGAGCAYGDEVRILGYAFTFEGTKGPEDQDDLVAEED